MQPSLPQKRKASQSSRPPLIPSHDIPDRHPMDVDGTRVPESDPDTEGTHRAKRPRLKVVPTEKVTNSLSSRRNSSLERTYLPSTPKPSRLSSPSFTAEPELMTSQELYMPSLLPPINRETLRELDLESILRNLQLRHDLLFDPNLQFRPSTSQRKQLVSDRYWIALERELEIGCVCTAWTARTGASRNYCGREVQGFCGEGTSNGRTIFSFPENLCSNALPSRLPTMLRALVHALHYIIAPPPPSPPPNVQPSPPRPSYLTALAEVEQLISHFDIGLMEQEIRRGIFEPEGIFKLIGEVLQKHCAPMRDSAIDTMIESARKRKNNESRIERHQRTLSAMKQCFELIDLMKLDIANHQLQHLRPSMISTTPEYELRVFMEKLRRGSTSLDVTREWLNTRKESSSSSTSSNPLVEAFTNLIFNPPGANAFGTTSPSTLSMTPSRLPAIPETLFLDSSRLNLLFTDAADLTATYMLLLLWRSFIFSSSAADSDSAKVSDATPRRQSQVEPWELERMKKEIKEVGPRRIGKCFLGKAWGGFADTEKDEETSRKNWEDEMESIIIQTVMRAEDARSQLLHSKQREENPYLTPTSPSERTIRRLPLPSSLSLLRSWVKSHMKRDSALAVRMREVLRMEVAKSVEELMQSTQDHFIPQNSAAYPCPPSLVTPVTPSPQIPSPPASPPRSPCSSPPPVASTETKPSPSCSGLEPLRYEINYLAARLVKMISTHEKIYGRLYRAEGLIQ